MNVFISEESSLINKKPGHLNCFLFVFVLNTLENAVLFKFRVKIIQYALFISIIFNVIFEVFDIARFYVCYNFFRRCHGIVINLLLLLIVLLAGIQVVVYLCIK